MTLLGLGLGLKLFTVENKMVLVEENHFYELHNNMITSLDISMNNKNIVEYTINGCCQSINSNSGKFDKREELIKQIYKDLKDK